MESLRIWHKPIELKPQYRQGYVKAFAKTLKPGKKFEIETYTSDKVKEDRIYTIKAVYPHVFTCTYRAGRRVLETSFMIKDLALNLVRWRKI